MRRGEGERGRQEREQTREVRNPASSDLPTLLASLLCAIPHLTFIREPTGRMEAGHPEGWENEEKGRARIYVHLNILGEKGPRLQLYQPPQSHNPWSGKWTSTTITAKAAETPSR